MPEDGLEPAVAHRLAKNAVHAIAQHRLFRRQHAYVVADAEVRILVHQPRVPAHAAVRQDRIQHHGVHAAERKIAVRMDVVFVGDRDETVLSLCGNENVVGEGGAERRHTAAAEVGERSIAVPIGLANRQDFAKLVVRNRDGESRTPGGAVFDAAESDVEVASCRGSVETREPDLHEPCGAAEPAGEKFRDFDVETDDPRRVLRIRFDKRRAAFGIAAPSQFAGRSARIPVTAAQETQARRRQSRAWRTHSTYLNGPLRRRSSSSSVRGQSSRSSRDKDRSASRRPPV